MPDLLDCEHVTFTAKLKDGRTLSWTHRVPSRDVDRRLGITRDRSQPYLSAEEFARLETQACGSEGIWIQRGEGKEELLPPDMISAISFQPGRRQLTVAELLLRGVYPNEPQDLRVRPPKRQPSAEDVVAAIDDVLRGRKTLNDLFRLAGQPQQPDLLAHSELKIAANGYLLAATEMRVDIQPLFADATLYQAVEIRRVQLMHGAASPPKRE